MALTNNSWRATLVLHNFITCIQNGGYVMELLVNEVYDKMRGYLGFNLIKLVSAERSDKQFRVCFTGYYDNIQSCLDVFRYHELESVECRVSYTVCSNYNLSDLKETMVYLDFIID